jgi:PAS domain S-box-containing protein
MNQQSTGRPLLTLLQERAETKPRSGAGCASPLPRAGTGHTVQFYEDEAFLAEAVTRFLGAGLAAGEPVVVLATPHHWEAFQQQLSAGAFDVQRARDTGQLTWLDASSTLDSILVDDMPDWRRFHRVVGRLVADRAARTGGPVRAYGEMVDLLSDLGNQRAALRLEEMWNRLGQQYPLSLLCAYVLGNFHRESDTTRFQAVCSAHTHVLPTESYCNIADRDARLREISLLQQRARALEGEVERRKVLERALRRALADRSRSEQALRRSQQELTDFLENAVEGLHCLDRDGRILWANRAELEMLGYDRADYVGHHAREFHLDPEVLAGLLVRLSRNETVRDLEARLRCQDGTVKHVLIHGNVYWRDGEFVHSRCFVHDITARKQTELRLHQAEEERRQLLEREQAARAEAVAANQAKDAFLAMLGHELRNPLAPIVTALQLARLRGNDSRELGVIERQVGHLTRLVDDLLDVARITRGKVELRRERMELAEVVAQAVETASPLLEQRRQVLSIDVPRTGCVVDGDRARLAQVVANLLTNAAKYSDIGAPVQIAAEACGPVVRLRVRDSGIGLEPHMLQRVFETFVQQPQAVDRSQGGLGLGLAIVRSLVQLHGGTVVARSEGPGKGSEFAVELPRIAQAAPPAGSAPAASAAQVSPAPRRERILVVDDNEDTARLMGDGLRMLGHEVRLAHDGPSALRVASEFRPTIGLLDIGLPVMDGYELAARLRDEPWAAQLRLIAVTGYGQESEASRCRAAGFAAHLVKPAELPHIERVIDALAQHR